MAKENLSDEFLLEQICIHEDHPSLEQLFKRYFQPLCTFAFTFVRDHAIAEELVSDTFCTIWFNRLKLNLPEKTRPYLYKAVRNHALNHLKKNKQEYASLIEAEQIPHTGSNPDQILIFKEMWEEVNLLIDTLPEKKRIIFRMNRLEGLKYKEIAEILGLSVHTVQNHMVEAIKQLAENSKSSNLLLSAALLFILS